MFKSLRIAISTDDWSTFIFGTGRDCIKATGLPLQNKIQSNLVPDHMLGQVIVVVTIRQLKSTSLWPFTSTTSSSIHG